MFLNMNLILTKLVIKIPKTDQQRKQPKQNIWVY